MPSIEELKSLDYKFNKLLKSISIRINKESINDDFKIFATNYYYYYFLYFASKVQYTP